MTGPAWAAAERAADRAGVRIRTLDRARPDPADAAGIADLCARIWHVPVEQSPAEPSTLIAYAHAGGYVGLAEAAGTLVGTAVGFPGHGPAGDSTGAPTRTFLHSHIAGVDRTRIGAGVGLALKLHQRARCLDRGFDEIEWTFDPLIARNAHFNLTRLGAVAADYLVDFYGPMTDGVNAGLPSDRLVVRWSLPRWPPSGPGAAPGARVLADDHGRPALDLDRWVGSGPVELAVPTDAETLPGVDPSRALAWRLALRQAVGVLTDQGCLITGFDRTVPGYRMERVDR